MKRFFCLLLMLCLALGCAVASAEQAPELPQPGDTVHGFTVKQVREMPLIGADVVLFEHDKTGAMLMYIANGDTNRVFDLTFLTRPTDNTGLPHVFEHSTLDGSEKYPSKALFFNLSNQTYNTYMNASTYSVMTTYPVASLSEAQLLKYADYYTDSCLHPTLMEDESVFREEAWRYRMPSLEDDLTIEGTVYSEMLGATTLARKAGMNAYRVTFPGSVVGLDQGGDPEFIPDMTWDSLKAYHDLFYHPSNSIAFLYGSFEDYTAFLALLDEAYAPYERADFHFVDSEYKRIESAQEASFAFPVEAGSSVDNKSMVYYYYLCPGLRDDAQEELVMNTLTDLAAADSSPLKQSLKKALPYATFGCYIDTTAPDDAICFYANNVNQEDAAVFRATVDAALQEIAQNGFAQDMVDGVMASVNMDIKLTPEGTEIGTDIIPSIAYEYATSGNPFSYMDYVEALPRMEEWNQQGLYQQAVQKWLIGNELTSLVTTYPVAGLKEEQDAALAAHLAEVKAAMSPEELQAIVDRTNAVAEEEDTSEMVSQLQAVTVASLPEEIKEYEIRDVVAEDGTRRVDAVAGVEGIGRVAIFLDAQGLQQEDIHWFKLFTDLVGELDTDAHTKDELDVLISRYLHSAEARLSLMGEDEDYHPYLRMGWIGMDEDLATSYELMYELVFGTQFTDTAKVLEKVQSVKTNLRTTINGNAYSVMLYRMFGKYNPLYRYYAYYNYLEYYSFLEQVEAMLTEQPDQALAKLQAVQSYFHNAANAMVAFAGNEASIALNSAEATAFLAKMDNRPIEPVVYELPAPADNEALVIDSSVQYNAVIADFETAGLAEYDAGLDAVTTLVQDVYLLPQLRDKYGVYSPQHGTLTDGGVYLFTYRDPNVRETFQVYEDLPAYMGQLNVDQETLDGYILSAYSYYATGSGELTGAMNAAVSTINGDPQDEALNYMRQLKSVTPEAVNASAEMYQKMVDNGVRFTAGSAGAINANAELYDSILNPFGVKDAAQVEFTDAAEGSDHYASVRFVYENMLMAPLSDTAFGVDENATVGDIMAAIYTYVGGASNAPEEARDWLAGYGIVDGSLDVNTELTEEFAINLLLQGFNVQLSTDTPEQVMTRGDLADLLQMLFDEGGDEEAADGGEEAPADDQAEAPADGQDENAAEEQVTYLFTDVAEDSEYYEAITAVVSNGLMAPRAATPTDLQVEAEFGADEPASVGDLAMVLYPMLTGRFDAEDEETALITVKAFGLIPETVGAGEGLTVKGLDDVLATLFAAMQMPYESIGQDDTQVLSRAQLAQVVYTTLLAE